MPLIRKGVNFYLFRNKAFISPLLSVSLRRIKNTKAKTEKIILDGYGSFLGRDKGCLLVRNSEGKEERYPLVENEIGEVQIKSGNSVSVGALATLGFWGIDCLVMTQRGHPVAVLKSLASDFHVETRIAQYEAIKSEKSLQIVKNIVLAKLQGQQEVLKKHGLRFLDYTFFEKNHRPTRG